MYIYIYILLLRSWFQTFWDKNRPQPKDTVCGVGNPKASPWKWTNCLVETSLEDWPHPRTLGIGEKAWILQLLFLSSRGPRPKAFGRFVRCLPPGLRRNVLGLGRGVGLVWVVQPKNWSQLDPNDL